MPETKAVEIVPQMGDYERIGVKQEEIRMMFLQSAVKMVDKIIWLAAIVVGGMLVYKFLIKK